jgi:hypothetical protein
MALKKALSLQVRASIQAGKIQKRKPENSNAMKTSPFPNLVV